MHTNDALRIGINAARAAARGEPYEEELAAAVSRRFATDACAGLTAWQMANGVVQGVRGVVITSWAQPRITPERVVAAIQAFRAHPQLDDMLSRPVASVHRVTDRVPAPRFWDSPVYETMHADFGGRYPAATVLLRTPDTLVLLGVQRQAADLTEKESENLQALAEPLAAAMAFRDSLDRAVSRLQQEPLGPDGPFTTREAETIALVARGWTNGHIARHLGMSESGVRQRLVTARERVAASNRAELVVRWNELRR